MHIQIHSTHNNSVIYSDNAASAEVVEAERDNGSRRMKMMMTNDCEGIHRLARPRPVMVEMAEAWGSDLGVDEDSFGT